ncbi:hypothetical protein [Rariglobus hedericola]|uniref:Uncharacterized protein n=1 Tax=Rariglobus hedericola TaxID=2597822 RepID=A0A556QRG4_9BACT|nr:hypothetical protein [Rariglobus hedericola]TSJ79235.1 hypothetical protein FPL22_08065 [Rariglobus hedericola]
MTAFLRLILVFLLGASIHAAETLSTSNAANLVGNQTGVVTRVIFVKIYGGESQSYLVESKGDTLVVQRNLGSPSAPLKVGDSITFDILQYKNPASKQPVLVFLEEPNAEFQERYRKASAKAAPAADSRPNVDLVIKQDGTFTVGGVATKQEGLSGLIQKIPKDAVVTLHSHPESSYTLTVKVLELLAAENIKNVTFTADSETP